MINAVKKWSLIDYIYLWVGVCFCVPTFMLVNTLWLNGFNLFESLIIVFIGNLLMGVIASIMLCSIKEFING